MSDTSAKTFDTVQMVRAVRDEVSATIATFDRRIRDQLSRIRIGRRGNHRARSAASRSAGSRSPIPTRPRRRTPIRRWIRHFAP